MSTTIKVDELTDIRVLRHNYLTLAVKDGHTINGATLHVVNNSVRVEGNVTQDTEITIATGTLEAGIYQFNHRVPYNSFHDVKVTFYGGGDMYAISGDLPNSGDTVTISQEVNFSLDLELKAKHGDGTTIFNDVAMFDSYTSSEDNEPHYISLDYLKFTSGGVNRIVWARNFEVSIYYGNNTNSVYLGVPLSAKAFPNTAPIGKYVWYQWSGTQEDPTLVEVGSGLTYTPQESDIGKKLCVVAYRSSAGSGEHAIAFSDNAVQGSISHSGHLYTMTSNSAPSPFTASAELVGITPSATTEAWKVFDSNDSTQIECGMNSIVQKHRMSATCRFGSSVIINKLHVRMGARGDAGGNFSIYEAFVYGIKSDGTEQLLASKRYDLQNNRNYAWDEVLSFNNDTEFVGVKAMSRYGSGNFAQRQWIATLDVTEWKV